MDQPFVFDFLTHQPTGELGRFVESLWYARGTVPYSQERIAPTGSSVSLFVFGDPISQTPDDGNGATLTSATGLLIGPHDRPIVNAPTGETHAIGIVTTPIGCQAVFGEVASSLRGRVLDLLDIWPAAKDLRSLLGSIESPAQQLQELEVQLESNPLPEVPGLDRCEAAVEALTNQPTTPIASLARSLGISHSHLNREFTRIVGLTPTALARIVRLQTLLSDIDVSGRIDWSGLAVELGWFDQAHLIRDFKRHTGTTPEGYLTAQRSAYGELATDGSAAGFVPEQ